MEHPKGVYAISLIEMWERFSFFIFCGILVLYMIEVLHFSMPFASILYGIIVGAGYLLQLVTGQITDTYFGNRKAIMVGSILMLASQLIFAFDASLYNLSISIPTHSSFLFTYPEIIFLIGVVFISLGGSFIKVSATSFISLFYKDQESLLDAAYTLFYMVFNIGSFFAPLALGLVVGVHDPSLYQYGFIIGAIANLIGLVTFLVVKDRYLSSQDGEPLGVRPISKEIKRDLGDDINKKLSKIEIDRIKASVIILVVVIMLCAAIEQISTSMLILVMNYVNNTVPFINYTLSPQMYISLNPFFVVLLSPIFIKIFSMLNHRNKEPSSIGKMTIGLFAIFISYLILLIPTYFSHGKINMLWIVLFNFTLVIAELFISPIALSLISKLAPVKHASLMIGTFYAATAVSALLAGVFASAFPEKPGVVNSLFGLIPIPNLASFIWIFVILSGLLLIIWTLSRNRIKKLMHGVE